MPDCVHALHRSSSVLIGPCGDACLCEHHHRRRRRRPEQPSRTTPKTENGQWWAQKGAPAAQKGPFAAAESVTSAPFTRLRPFLSCGLLGGGSPCQGGPNGIPTMQRTRSSTPYLVPIARPAVQDRSPLVDVTVIRALVSVRIMP